MSYSVIFTEKYSVRFLLLIKNLLLIHSFKKTDWGKSLNPALIYLLFKFNFTSFAIFCELFAY